MEKQILAELKSKYAGQLTSKFMESLAKRLAEKVEKEEDIQGAISELETSVVKIGDIQTEGDRRVSELNAKLKDAERRIEEAAKPVEPPIDNVSKLEAMMKELQSKFDAKEIEAKKDKARALLLERVADKRIPKVLLDKVSIDSPDEVDDVIERLEEDHRLLRKEMGVDLSQDPPRRGEPNTGGSKQVIEDLKRIKPK